jgi:hypothetical protein
MRDIGVGICVILSDLMEQFFEPSNGKEDPASSIIQFDTKKAFRNFETMLITIIITFQ